MPMTTAVSSANCRPAQDRGQLWSQLWAADPPPPFLATNYGPSIACGPCTVLQQCTRASWSVKQPFEGLPLKGRLIT